MSNEKSNENPTVYGEVGVGSYILNDYVLTVEEADEGYVLNIKKGSEEQTAQILIGPKGDKGDKGDKGERGDSIIKITVSGTKLIIEPSELVTVVGTSLVVA